MSEAMTVTAGDLRKGDQIRIAGSSAPYEIESVHILTRPLGNPPMVEIVGQSLTGPPTWREKFNIRLACDTLVTIWRPEPPKPHKTKIEEFIERIAGLPIPERHDLRDLIVELARLVKDHAHTDGAGVNWTEQAAWRPSPDFAAYKPPGVFCQGALDDPDNNFNQDYR